MWFLNPVLCKNVKFNKVATDGIGPNNDGCDPECCTDVLIKGCSFNNGDDCIAIKSGRNLIINRSIKDGNIVFYIENGSEKAYSGGSINLDENSKIIIRVSRKATIRIIHDGHVVFKETAKKIKFPIKHKGKYRLEVYYNKMPWIFSNPILVK